MTSGIAAIPLVAEHCRAPAPPPGRHVQQDTLDWRSLHSWHRRIGRQVVGPPHPHHAGAADEQAPEAARLDPVSQVKPAAVAPRRGSRKTADGVPPVPAACDLDIASHEARRRVDEAGGTPVVATETGQDSQYARLGPVIQLPVRRLRRWSAQPKGGACRRQRGAEPAQADSVGARAEVSSVKGHGRTGRGTLPSCSLRRWGRSRLRKNSHARQLKSVRLRSA